MKGHSKFAPHETSWGLIRVRIDGEAHRYYELDAQGRLTCKVPRQKKRQLVNPLRAPSVAQPIQEPYMSTPSEVDFLWQHAEGPEPMPMDFLMGGPLLGDFALPDPIY
jgi:hypothetical protein